MPIIKTTRNVLHPCECGCESHIIEESTYGKGQYRVVCPTCGNNDDGNFKDSLQHAIDYWNGGMWAWDDVDIPGFTVMSYEEFKESRKKPEYFGKECYVGSCHEPAEYEGGDTRCWCGMCEEHANIRRFYENYVHDMRRIKKIRNKWVNL